MSCEYAAHAGSPHTTHSCTQLHSAAGTLHVPKLNLTHLPFVMQSVFAFFLSNLLDKSAPAALALAVGLPLPLPSPFPFLILPRGWVEHDFRFVDLNTMWKGLFG